MNSTQALDDSGAAARQVSSYDDLSVSADPSGAVVLECPACGPIRVPQRETTLSDLTNAGMEHLSEHHPYTLTLPSRRSRAKAGRAATQQDRTAVRSGHFTEVFWSLIALLDGNARGIEGLVLALAASSPDEIVDFSGQLQSAQRLLDTPQHRAQQVQDLDNHLQTAPAAMSDDEFADVRLAVVAAGRDVWLDVLAHPAHLARGWSLQASRALLEAPEAALRRVRTGQPHPTAGHPRATTGHPRATAGHPRAAAGQPEEPANAV